MEDLTEERNDMEKERYIIKDARDRREMCAIYAENGYSVKMEDVRIGNRACKAVVVWKDKNEGEKKEQ